jgi:glycosyltransferase involved in cell wall biosynthesis
MTEGGGRSYIRNLLRELGADPRGFEFTVLCASGQLSEAEACGLRRSVVSLPPPSGSARTILRVLYEEVILPFQARSFDVLYCIADLAPALGLTPTVVALRNLNIYDRRFFNDARVRNLERLVRLGVRRAHRVIFPTRAAADLIRQRIRIPEARVRVVPHGIAAEAFDSPATESGERAPYLFLPAAVEPHKNVGVLIECLPLLAEGRMQAWIAGSTDTYPAHAAEMRALVEARGLGSRVRFLGSVPYREILRYHRGAVALVFPSFLESFGHPLLEAMLAGTPIIAADIPSLREVAGDAALYFDPHEPAELARTVDRLAKDTELARASVERGTSRAAEFTWKRSVDRLCSVFDEVLR